MNKFTQVLMLILLVALLVITSSNKMLIKELEVKLSEMQGECIVARDVEPMIIIGVVEEGEEQ